MSKITVTGKQLGGLLFNLHKHDNNGDIIYKENDIIRILKAIGLPDVEWGESLSLNDYLNTKTLEVYTLIDSVEELIKLNEIIDTHSSNQSTIMVNQYKASRDKIINKLLSDLKNK